jgi:hypothetical protein
MLSLAACTVALLQGDLFAALIYSGIFALSSRLYLAFVRKGVV